MADLNDLKPKSDTIEVLLRHPSTDEILTYAKGKDKVEMSISIYNPYSAAYKAAIHAQTNKRLVKAAKNRKSTYTAEELDRASLDLLVAITAGWDIFIGGEAPKFTVDKAKEVFETFPWIRDQLDEAMNDTAAFLKA
jgi:hypothetical protein